MRKYERDREYALKVIDSCIYGTLSMVDLKGDPYGVPISLARIDDHIYFHGSLKGKKMEILQNTPRVSLSCVGKFELVEEEFTTYYQSAIVEGVVEIVEDRDEKVEGLRTLSLKYASSSMDKFEEAIDRSIDKTMVFKMYIENIYGKGKI